MARYHVLHETTYDYGSPVSLSQQQLHVSPRVVAWQRCLEHRVEIEPEPTWRHEGLDTFDNPVLSLSFHSPHTRQHVRSETTIEVRPHLPPEDLAASPAWEEVRERLAYGARPPLPDDLDAAQFLFESPCVSVKREFAAFAAGCFPPGTPVLVGTRALMERIYTEFEFDAEATTVSTPVTEVLEKKRGVCQDFAHLMIASLRSLGLAARYVSGYLLTRPPPGQPRLTGADASHAWVSVYCPGVGEDWVDFDPTNKLLPDTQHITIAYGRDFADVSPQRGIILGGGVHEPAVAVTVTSLDEIEDTRGKAAGKTAESAAEPVTSVKPGTQRRGA